MELRRLSSADRPQIDHLLAQHPVLNCMLIARLETHGLGGAECFGVHHRGRLQEFVHIAGNLVPAGGDAAAAALVAERICAQPPRSVSLVGSAPEVTAMWDVLRPAWGPARDERLDQPLLLATEPAEVPADPLVRTANVADNTALFGPSVAMFTEEVGISPLEGASEASYRARLMWLIRTGRVLCRFDADGVLFKAEIAAVTPQCCQVQGVWVRPDMRGRGIGSSAMVSVVNAARAMAPHVSLYVNHYNTAALHAYHRAGFRQVGTMASVHF